MNREDKSIIVAVDPDCQYATAATAQTPGTYAREVTIVGRNSELTIRGPLAEDVAFINNVLVSLGAVKRIVLTPDGAGADVAIGPKLDAIPGPTGITHKHPCPTCGQAVYSESVDRLFAATEKCIDAGDTKTARTNLDTLRAQLGDDDLKVIGLDVMLRFTEDPSGDF